MSLGLFFLVELVLAVSTSTSICLDMVIQGPYRSIFKYFIDADRILQFIFDIYDLKLLK